jgi:AraC-like DNA-binding protein
MPVAAIDIALRAAAIALLLVLAISLARDYRACVAGRLGIALALGSAAHAASFNIGVSSVGALWHAPLIALSTGNVVVLWLFCRALFDDGFALRGRHALIWLAVTTFSLVNCLWLAPLSSARVAVIAANLLALGFIALSLAQTVSSWSVDLVEGRRRVRAFIVLAAVLYGGVNAVLQIAGAGGAAADLANTVNAAMLAAVVAAISVAMLQIGAGDLFADAAPTSIAEPGPLTPELTAADQRLIATLLRLMADERIYRQESLTIGMLATRLSTPEYRLRRLINQGLGYRNFSAFLNNHRIEEAKAALADPAQAQVPVITIAMDAGFQSLGPFNRAFKAVTGVTPSDYRRLKVAAV